MMATVKILLLITMLGFPLASCTNLRQESTLPKLFFGSEINFSPARLNLTIEDAIEHSILHSAMGTHPAGKKLLTQKQAFRKLAMSCLKDNRTDLGLGGQFYGPYELPENRYIFALNCASYITGPELRLFIMNAEGVIGTTPLEIETIDVHSGGEYEIKSSIQVFGFPEYDANKPTLSFRNYCKTTTGRQNFRSVYKITDETLKLEEVWLDKQEKCGEKPNLQRAF
jgi:hypothetical protein